MERKDAEAAMAGVQRYNSHGFRDRDGTLVGLSSVLRALEALPSVEEAREHMLSAEKWEQDCGHWKAHAEKAEAELKEAKEYGEAMSRDGQALNAQLKDMTASMVEWRGKALKAEAELSRVPARLREAFVGAVRWAEGRGGTLILMEAEAARRFSDPAGEDDYQQHTDMPDPAPVELSKLDRPNTAPTLHELHSPAPMMRCEAAERCEKHTCSHIMPHKVNDLCRDRCCLQEGFPLAVCKPVEDKLNGITYPQGEPKHVPCSAPVEPAPRFRVGDRVRIARREPEPLQWWMGSMDQLIGGEGTITSASINDPRAWVVDGGGSSWVYPEVCLEKVEQKPAECQHEWHTNFQGTWCRKCGDFKPAEECKHEWNIPVNRRWCKKCHHWEDDSVAPPAEEEDIAEGFHFPPNWTISDLDDLRTLARRIEERCNDAAQMVWNDLQARVAKLEKREGTP